MRLAILLLAALPLAAQCTKWGVDPAGPPTLTLRCLSTTPGGVTPVAWYKYSVAKTSGNWLINGANSQAAAEATSQAITLFTLPANGFIHDVRVKTTTACAGVTALTVASVGLTGSAAYYATGLTLDLKAAVSNTNLLLPAIAARGSSTAAAIAITITLSAGVENVSVVTDGCAFDVHVFWSTLP